MMGDLGGLTAGSKRKQTWEEQQRFLAMASDLTAHRRRRRHLLVFFFSFFVCCCCCCCLCIPLVAGYSLRYAESDHGSSSSSPSCCHPSTLPFFKQHRYLPFFFSSLAFNPGFLFLSSLPAKLIIALPS